MIDLPRFEIGLAATLPRRGSSRQERVGQAEGSLHIMEAEGANPGSRRPPVPYGVLIVR